METPPSNIQAKNTGYNQNYRLETPINNDTDEYVKNEYLSKINPSFFFFLKLFYIFF